MQLQRAILPIISAIFIIFLTTSCRQNPNSANDDTIQITVSDENTLSQVGETMLIVTLHDQNGQALDNASLALRGDMSHAGMNPMLAEVNQSNAGRYEVPFIWSMAGDWTVTVTASFADGTRASQDFEFTVAGQ